MTDNAQDNDRIRRIDVARLPFTAGVVLTISGLLSVVLGLYILNTWFGWGFIAVGILIAAAGLMLVFRVRRAPMAGIVAGLVSIGFTATWAPAYVWFMIPIIGFDVLAIYALTRFEVRSRSGRNPLRTA